jgi:hypothetical protein
LIKLHIVNEVVYKTGITKTKAEMAVDAVFESMKLALAWRPHRAPRLRDLQRAFSQDRHRPQPAHRCRGRNPLRVRSFVSGLAKNCVHALDDLSPGGTKGSEVEFVVHETIGDGLSDYVFHPALALLFDASVVLAKVHPRVQTSHLITIAVELNSVAHPELTKPPLFPLVQPNGVHLGVDVWNRIPTNAEF